MSRRVMVLVGIGLALLASPARAGWTTLGSFPAPERSGQSLLFRSEQAVASVTVLASDIVRVPSKSLSKPAWKRKVGSWTI